MVTFDTIWRRIKANQGHSFQQIRGREFTFEIVGQSIVLSTTNQNIPHVHLEEASRLLPLRNTVPVQHLRGPSYIYAILMDSRIRQQDW